MNLLYRGLFTYGVLCFVPNPAACYTTHAKGRVSGVAPSGDKCEIDLLNSSFVFNNDYQLPHISLIGKSDECFCV